MNRFKVFRKIMLTFGVCCVLGVLIHIVSGQPRQINNYDENQVKKIAYDSIDSEFQETIISNVEDDENIWEYAQLEEITYSELGYTTYEEKSALNSYLKRNRQVAKVVFETRDVILGPIVVYVDLGDNEVVGYGLRL